MCTIKCWKALSREVVQSLSLEFFETWLEKALRSPVWPHTWPCFEQEVGAETSWGPFQPKLSYEFVNWNISTCKLYFQHMTMSALKMYFLSLKALAQYHSSAISSCTIIFKYPKGSKNPSHPKILVGLGQWMIKAQVLQRLCASMGTRMHMSALGNTSMNYRLFSLDTWCFSPAHIGKNVKRSCQSGSPDGTRMAWTKWFFKSAPSLEMHVSVQIKKSRTTSLAALALALSIYICPTCA